MNSMILFLTLIFQIANSFHSEFVGSKKIYSSHFNGTDHEPAQCSVEHFQLLARHGSRYPAITGISKFSRLYDVILQNRHHLTDKHLFLKEWYDTSSDSLVNPYTNDVAGDLLPRGEEEHYLLAKRFKERFPSIFNRPYTPKAFEMHTTEIARSAQSANAFGYGIFETNKSLLHFTPFWTYSHRKKDDRTLRFHDNCPKYRELKHSGKHEATQYYDQILPVIAKKIQKKLNTNDKWVITDFDVKQMYLGCIYDITLHDNVDNFCALFDQEDMEQLEYADDLEEFYAKGYAQDINYEMACLLVTEIITLFEHKISKHPDYKVHLAKLRFAHGETVVPIVATLGLFKPKSTDEMKWNSSIQTIRERVWRGSKVSPFGANVAFILYNCGNEYKVKVLHNEQPMLIPGCPDVHCPFDTFKSIMSRYYKCDFNNVCGIVEAKNQKCEPTHHENEYAFEVFHLVTAFVVGLFIGMVLQRLLINLYSTAPTNLLVKEKED